MEQLKKRLEALNGSEKFWAAAVFCFTFAAFAPALPEPTGEKSP